MPDLELSVLSSPPFGLKFTVLQLETAAHYLHQALTLSRTAKEADRRGEAASLRLLGQVSLARSQLGEGKEAHDQLNKAEEYLSEALSIHREVQDQEGESNTLSLLGDLAKVRAEELYRESLNLFRKGGQNRHIADALVLLGGFLIEGRGKPEEGCSMLLEAKQLYEQMGIHNIEMDSPSEQKAREMAQRLEVISKNLRSLR